MSKYAQIPWHTMSIEEVEQTLKTDRYRGMSAKQARRRRERVGENDLFTASPMTPGECTRIFGHDAAMLMLLLLCLVGCCFSLWSTVICTLCLLLLYGGLTVVALVKTRAVRGAMSEYGAPQVELIRSGRRMSAQAHMLVPGDLICLQKGDVVPADVRLVGCDARFCVRTLREYRDGRAVYETAAPKDPDALLPAGETAVLSRQNMAYAGSIVADGSAVALVVTTGEDAYHGALSGKHALAAASGELPCLAQIRKYVNRYSLWMCALLLPVTVIGYFAGKGTPLFDLLFAALSLVVASMSEQLLTLAQIVIACGVVRSASAGRGDKAAIIKNYAAMEKIGGLTDVFFVGAEALFDGDFHPTAAILEGKMFRAGQLNSTAMRQLYPYLHWFDQCRASSAMTLADGNLDELTLLLRGIRELRAQMTLDEEELQIRLSSMVMAPDGSGDVLLTLRASDGSPIKRRVFCTTQISLTDRCVGSAAGDVVQYWQPNDRARIQAAMASLQKEGCRWLLCATRREVGCVLEGAIALRPAVVESLPSVREDLQSHGVRTTLVVPHLTEVDIALLMQSEMISHPHEIVSCAGLSLPALTALWREGTPCVMTDIDEQMVTELISVRQKEGGSCAVVLLREVDSGIIAAADVVASYDAKPFRMNGVAERKPQPMSEEERAVARQAAGDDSLRRAGDVILRRGCRDGGAFGGILNAVRTCRSIHNHLALMLQYLQATQFLRMTFLLLPLLFGSVMLSSPLMLLSGLWIDFGCVVLIAFRRGGEEELLCAKKMLLSSKHPVVARVDRVAASVLTGAIVLLISLLLKTLGVIANADGQRIFVFLCLLAVQTTAFFLFYQNGNRGVRLPLLCSMLLLLMPPLLLLCFPAIAACFGCAPCRPSLVLICLLSTVIFLLCSLLCASLRGKLRRWLRRILSNLAS